MEKYYKTLQNVKDKFEKEIELSKDDVNTLFSAIHTLESNIELLNKIIREKRHILEH